MLVGKHAKGWPVYDTRCSLFSAHCKLLKDRGELNQGGLDGNCNKQLFMLQAPKRNQNGSTWTT